MCDKIAIINEGNIIANGKTDDLINDMGKNHIIIKSNINQIALSDEFNWSHEIKDNEIIIESNNPDTDIVDIINFFNSKDIKIDKIRTEQSTLEEIFIKLTNEK